MPLYIQESFVNRTKGYRYGDSDVYEAFTDDVGRLFRDLQREYGRCESACYIEDSEAPGGARRIGWVFVKRVPYDDARTKQDTYEREVWVTLHDAPPQTRKTFHYHDLGETR